MSSPDTLLAAIPDSWEHAHTWFAEASRRMAAFRWSHEAEQRFVAVDVEETVGPPSFPFGYYGDSRWRRLALAALASDWACYPASVDRVAFERLLYAMHTFPRGFRLWWTVDSEQSWLPVGYSGWHPISASTFERLEQGSETLRDRAILPIREFEASGSYAYLFNFSVVSPLRKTPCSRMVVQRVMSDLNGHRLAGIAAITVSPDGARVVARSGLQKRATVAAPGGERCVHTIRYEVPR